MDLLMMSWHPSQGQPGRLFLLNWGRRAVWSGEPLPVKVDLCFASLTATRQNTTYPHGHFRPSDPISSAFSSLVQLSSLSLVIWEWVKIFPPSVGPSPISWCYGFMPRDIKSLLRMVLQYNLLPFLTLSPTFPRPCTLFWPSSSCLRLKRHLTYHGQAQQGILQCTFFYFSSILQYLQKNMYFFFILFFF